MSLLSLPLRIPLLPFTGLIWLAEVLEEEGQRQLDAEVRQQVEDAQEARLSGQASEEEIERLEELALQSLTGWRPSLDRGHQPSDPEEQTVDD